MPVTTASRLGALCWIAALPLLLLVSVVTGAAWDPPYSWALHNVSDLGNVTCGVWDTSRPRPVCSPWHGLMNAGLVALGVLVALGTVLTWRAVGRGAWARTAQVLVVLAGLGYVLAGARPADVDENTHVLGALLVLGFGNVGLLAAAAARSGTAVARLRPATLVLGAIGTAGVVLFFTRHGLGLGVGGMERVALYPLLAWVGCLGVAFLRGAGSRPGGPPGTGAGRGGQAGTVGGRG